MIQFGERGALLEKGTVVTQAVSLQGVPDGDDEAVTVDGLYQIVIGAVAHGLDGGRYFVDGADDDAFDKGEFLLDFGQQIKPAFMGHDQIQQDELKTVLRHQVQNLAAVGNQGRLRQAVAEQGRLDTQQDAGVVIDGENGGDVGWYKFHCNSSIVDLSGVQ
jgi:hypothetical protein